MKARYLCVVAVALAVVAVAAGGQQAGLLVAEWTRHAPPADETASPKNVSDGAMVYDPAGRRIVLFGGKNAADRRVDELWAFDVATSAWQQIATEGVKPPSIPNLSAIYDPIGRRMIAYGDRNLWAFDLTTDRWRDMSRKDQPRRESHSAVYDSRGKRMVVFGGSDGGRLDLYDVWAFDLDPMSPTFEQWQNLTVEAGHPAGRIQHNAVYDAKKNRMVIYGGYSKASRQMYQDTWAYQFADARDQPGTWKRIDDGRLFPPARREAIGVYNAARNWFVVEGGESPYSTSREPLYMNDAWVLDLTADVWIPISPGESGPEPKINQQAAYDSDADRLIVYGGIPQDEHSVPHDVWELHIGSGE